MASDACSANLVSAGGACPGVVKKTYPGEPFFKDFTTLLTHNPNQRNYGVSVTDIDGDGKLEAVVAGFGSANLAFQWDSAAGNFKDIALGNALLQDVSGQAIGVAACDVDGDGYEELYILNTDSYSGVTQTSDVFLDRNNQSGIFSDHFKDAHNSGNYVAGRSCACVDRTGDGKYGVMVANYGGPMKLFEMEAGGKVVDVAGSVGMAKTTGGRALIAGPIISNRFDVFANNEGYGGGRLLSESRRLSHRRNFFFSQQADGQFLDAAEALGILDASNTGRGTAVIDANGDGLLDIVYGNWQGEHRLFIQKEKADGCVYFDDMATAEMKVPSPIRTVIVADFDNDGHEEIFWNNIPGDNRLFRKLPSDADWVQVNIGDALESTGYGTGGAMGDFDGDGLLELFISHGESASQPMSYFRPTQGKTNHWIRIAPRTSQGAPARGALVTLVMADGRKQTRLIDSGSGYLCQQEPVAHFGLGTSTTITSVTIQWPDGVQHTIKAPVVDKLHTIPKPVGLTPAPAYILSLNGNCLKRTIPQPVQKDAGVTPAAQELKITGDVTLKLADADAFLADTGAKNAVKAGIADSMGVPESQVAVVFAKARRLSEERLLAGTNVKVSYTITVPASAGAAAHTAAQNKANTATESALTTAISAKVTAAKGNSYTVSVESMTTPSGKVEVKAQDTAKDKVEGPVKSENPAQSKKSATSTGASPLPLASSSMARPHASRLWTATLPVGVASLVFAF